jgi:hypothetical protein
VVWLFRLRKWARILSSLSLKEILILIILKRTSTKFLLQFLMRKKKGNFSIFLTLRKILKILVFFLEMIRHKKNILLRFWLSFSISLIKVQQKTSFKVFIIYTRNNKKGYSLSLDWLLIKLTGLILKRLVVFLMELIVYYIMMSKVEISSWSTLGRIVSIYYLLRDILIIWNYI